MNEDNRQERKQGLVGIIIGTFILAPSLWFHQPLAEKPNKITAGQYLTFSGEYISSVFFLTGLGLYAHSLVSDLIQRRKLKKSMKSANYQKTKQYKIKDI